MKWGLSGLWTGLTLALVLIAVWLCLRWLKDSGKVAAVHPASG